MDTFKVTDEGGGIIRVDAETRLMRRAMAEEICAEVIRTAGDHRSFKILMNMGAMSKGTPGAGLYTLREMKRYDLAALALYRANGFMRGMAAVVLGLSGFRNFALFDDETEAMEWLKNAEAAPAAAEPVGDRLRQAAPSLALVAGGAVTTWFGLRKLKAAVPALVLLGGGAAATYVGAERLRR